MRSPTNASTSEECPEANDISLPIRPKDADVTLPLASRKCRATRGRSRTLGAPGDFASLHQLLTRETEVEGLHRALAESREEALLAARIGQTLLERNQEMDAEIERKDIANADSPPTRCRGGMYLKLSSRAEYAEHEAKALESRLKSAHNQIRVLEVARVKAIDETERLADELEHHRLRQVAWQTQLAKSRDEIKQLEDAKYAADQASERVREELATLQSAHAHLADDYAALARRMHEQLSATEQFHQERLQLLENDSVFHRQQKHAVERRERVLRSENEQITAQLIAQESALRDQVAHTGVLDDTIDRLTEELDDVKDALRQEQLRVAQLHEKTRELEDQLSWQQGMDLEQQFETISPTSRLRSGSLFFELSRELTTDRLSLPEPPAQPMHVTKQPENQVAIEERRDIATSPVKPAAADETPSDTTEATEDCPTPARSCENHNILKEFFMLTAAAVKITGAGLGNDTCNIHNEELYEEAMSQDITFDQYHIWLVARLEGANKSE